jgi:hypothetical protein
VSVADIWIPAAAALAGAAIGVGGSFGLTMYQNSRAGRDARKTEALSTYGELVSASLQMMLLAQAMGLVMRTRTGLLEGFSVMMRQAKPVDAIQLYDWIRGDLQRLHDAWSRVQATGSQDGVDAADRLLDACSDFMGAAVATDDSRSPISRVVLGERPSPSQIEQLSTIMARVAAERMSIVRIARREAGRSAVVFTFDKEQAKRHLNADDADGSGERRSESSLSVRNTGSAI